MDVESHPVKRARKAEGVSPKEAAAADAARSAAARERVRKLSEEFAKDMATPLTSDELRQMEEQREKFISESWERFRDNWFYGNFPYDAVTEIPCMRFTDVDLKDPFYAYHLRARDALQIVSVQVRALTGGLHWPLDVYGFVAVHDVLDRKRTMVFSREREDCPTINKEDSYLRLTGPTRGVVINSDVSYLEVVLKVKSLTDSEDKYLSKFATSYRLGRIDPIEYTSKFCTLEMQHYTALLSVEATVSVRVFEGKWPHGFRGLVNATTAGQEDIQIALLVVDRDELPADAHGFVKLSRRVVCVEQGGRLRVSLFQNGVGELANIWFPAEKSQRSTQYMPVKKLSLWLEVTVAWSLF